MHAASLMHTNVAQPHLRTFVYENNEKKNSAYTILDEYENVLLPISSTVLLPMANKG